MSEEIKFASQLKQEEIEQAKIKFRECYYEIIEVLKKYCDLHEHYYPLISLWILGTYLHKQFGTYPILFLNATKGSGKTRLLRLISMLSKDGKLVADLKEAVLFRTAQKHTICLDEFERVGSKENSTLRTLLNASYKKGVCVERMKKVRFMGQDEMVVESFDVYTPVAIANIWGMEDVLSDRCITLILEKSINTNITKLAENFELDLIVKSLKQILVQLVYTLCSVVTSENIYTGWNNYVIDKYTPITTLNTLNYNTTHTTQTTQDIILTEFFNKVDKLDIDSRNLELFFPLFIIANEIGEEILEEILKVAEEIIHEKKSEEYAENRDVSLIDFISHKIEWRGSFMSVHEITTQFKLTTMEDPEEDKWLNPKWVGRALKRSKLVIQKRRVGKGVEVMVDVDKAKKLILRFKEPEKKEVQDIIKHETKKEEPSN